jgi:ABC-type Fe3+/spermidine/putrescine transport system ATPase subunit
VELNAGYQGLAGLPDDASGLAEEVSIAIRPEQLSFVDRVDEAQLTGTVQQIAYFGSGFDYRIAVTSGETIMLRLANRSSEHRSYAVGDQAHISIGANSMQILSD